VPISCWFGEFGAHVTTIVQLYQRGGPAVVTAI
jgi:hypothetical protein